MRSGSLTRDLTGGSCTGSSESQSLDHQGSSKPKVLNCASLVHWGCGFTEDSDWERRAPVLWSGRDNATQVQKENGRHHHRGGFSAALLTRSGNWRSRDRSSATVHGISPSFKTTVMDHPHHYFFHEETKMDFETSLPSSWGIWNISLNFYENL